MDNEPKELQKEINKHHKFIENFVRDYCKSDDDRDEFFRHLGLLIDAEIEMEKYCNG